MSPQDKAMLYLPHFFNKNIYDVIIEFIANKPIFSPPYMHDLIKDSKDVHKALSTTNCI
jgi:hypothetical protein